MDDDKGPDDILFIQRVLSGDSAAFAVLVERYACALRRFCALRLGNQDDAEDAVQDVFLRAYRALPSFRLGASFQAWLFTIAFNRVKTRYSAKSSEKSLRERAAAEFAALRPDGAAGDTESEAIASLEAWAARAAIGRLGRANRAVAELYYVGGLNVDETAAALGLGRENVKSRLFRARKEIHKLLAGNATEEPRKG
jgi:RNA polymerase sigma factor (sigma-70 family)